MTGSPKVKSKVMFRSFKFSGLISQKIRPSKGVSLAPNKPFFSRKKKTVMKSSVQEHLQIMKLVNVLGR